MTILHTLVFRSGHALQEPHSDSDLSSLDTASSPHGAPDFVWVDLRDPTEQELRDLADRLGLHELAVDTALQERSWTRLEQFGPHQFLALTTATTRTPAHAKWNTINVFFGPGYVISTYDDDGARQDSEQGSEQDSENLDVATARERLLQQPERARLGPVSVVHALVDAIVERCHQDIDDLVDTHDEIEENVFARTSGVSRKCHQLAQSVLRREHALHRLPGVLHKLTSNLQTNHQHEQHEQHEQLLTLLDDATERVDHALHRLEALRASAENTLNLDSALASKDLAEISVQQGDQSKKIASWAAIIVAPQIIATIYSMNFADMPELHWALGYPVSIAAMVAMAAILFGIFKRHDWL